MSAVEKTHYRKAFNSPYLSSAYIVEPTVLTIKYVALEIDKTKKTKDCFNTAHFVEKEIRQGEPLKPMILNATNSRTMKDLTGSAFIEDWLNIPVTIYVDSGIKFGRDTVDGLRISSVRPNTSKPVLTPDSHNWANAVDAVKRDGNADAVKARVILSDKHMIQLLEEAGVSQH